MKAFLGFIYLLELSFLIAFDLGLKHIIRQTGGFYVCNKGISWGIQLPNVLFWLIWGILISLLFYFLLKFLFNKAFFIQNQALLLILAGTLGNFQNRIEFGCVFDFIKINLFSFPLFNLADIFIFFGCTVLIFSTLKEKNCG